MNLPIKQRLEMKDLSTYSGYTVVELLNDDYFLESERNPTEDSRKFWEELESHEKQLRTKPVDDYLASCVAVFHDLHHTDGGDRKNSQGAGW